MKKSLYTIEAGRSICRDGKPFVGIMKAVDTNPTDADIFARAIPEWANNYDELVAALQALMSNRHIDLGDQVYQVREREGLGWDGQSVKQWSDAVTAAKAVLAKVTP